MVRVRSHAIDDDQARIARAVRRRLALPHTAVRLVAGAADGMPGLVVDRYGAVVRIETASREAGAHAGTVVDVVRTHVTDITAIVHVARDVRGTGTLDELFGHAPEAHVVDEGGLRFLVRTREEEALGTGIFFDQRRGRALVRAHAHGGPVMNLFAHAGGFTVAAARGGASRVDHVDMSKKCARWGAVNLALNGVNPREHRFVVDDAIVFLARAAKKGRAYRVIVCDPPTTAIRPDGSRMVARDLLDALARDALTALSDGGLLLFSCNDRSITDDDLRAIVTDAARMCGRALASLAPLPFDDDVLPDGDRALASTRAVVAVVR
jgi:23S rRNA (cytosine1962-C5)-methyltransferase